MVLSHLKCWLKRPESILPRSKLQYLHKYLLVIVGLDWDPMQQDGLKIQENEEVKQGEYTYVLNTWQ